jgi:hypothetical protein
MSLVSEHRVVDEEVTDEVKDPVTNKSSDHQPIVPLEAETLETGC